MATTKSNGEYENRLTLYKKVIAAQPAIERKGKHFHILRITAICLRC
jgi:hypothetical protein